MGPEQVVEGINITADSFYSSQGRIDPSFEDRNETLLHDLVAAFPTAVALEMETFQLFHLARLCRPVGSIRAAAAGLCVTHGICKSLVANAPPRPKHRPEPCP